MKRMIEMTKRPKTAPEELWFVRRYCYAKPYPGSNFRCRYVKAKIMAKSSEISAGMKDFQEMDGMFLCRYPDESMPTHEARLISELDQCPDSERKEGIDNLFRLENG